MIGEEALVIKKEKEDRDFQAKALKDRNDMTGLFSFLKLIFGQFGMNDDGEEISPEELVGDLTEDDIIHSSVFQSELKANHVDFDKVYVPRPAALGNDNKAQPVSSSGGYGAKYGVFASDATADAALRATISIGIERYAKQSMNRGVTYKMGAKGDGNSIDCSGFVDQSIKKAMNAALPEGSKNLTGVFCTHSDGQVSGLAQKTGFMLSGNEVKMSNLKAGMVIGIDSGDKGWDRGRQNGIDHVGIVYADSETGKLMFAESRGGKGVMATPLEDWLKMANNKNYGLYASDAVKLASAEYKQQVADKIQHNSESKVAVVDKQPVEQVVAATVQAPTIQITPSLLTKPV